MIHSFLIIGQSNMAGRGKLDEAQPLDKDKLLVLRNGRWQPMYRPVNNDRPFSGVCLAESFARLYADENNITTGIIPCADGDTSLDDWQEGSLLYDNAVNQARLAQRTSEIAGVLWHQGEADCRPERYPFYEEKLSKLINALRRDLNLFDVPFVFGELGEYLESHPAENLKNYKYINAALAHYVKNTPMTGLASSKGLTPNLDILHFNTKSLMEFGKRYYEVFKRL